MLISICFLLVQKCASLFCEETTRENNQFSTIVNMDIQFILDQLKLQKDTLLHKAMSSFHGGLLRITLTVPLKCNLFYDIYTMTCVLIQQPFFTTYMRLCQVATYNRYSSTDLWESIIYYIVENSQRQEDSDV